MKQFAAVVLMLGLCACAITVRALGFPADEVKDWDAIAGIGLFIGTLYLFGAD